MTTSNSVSMQEIDTLCDTLTAHGLSVSIGRAPLANTWNITVKLAMPGLQHIKFTTCGAKPESILESIRHGAEFVLERYVEYVREGLGLDSVEVRA